MKPSRPPSPRPSAWPLMLPLCAALLSACGGGGGGGDSGVPDTVAPAAPAAVFANPAATGADVGWAKNSETDIAAYEVTATVTPADATVPPVTKSADASAGGTQISGLLAGRTYSVQVRARDNAGNTSLPSSVASVHVPRASTAAEELRYSDAASYANATIRDGRGVLIVRDGQVVFSEFPEARTAASPQVLASGTKSFSCALMLAAEQDGLISRDMPVSDVITEWSTDAGKSTITVRELLSLQGLAGNPGYRPDQVDSLDTYQLAINDTAIAARGEAFVYDPLAFQAFALMIERKGSGDPVEYLQRKVFRPIGLENDIWQRDAQGHPQMAGGATMSALAWARYGQLMLQGGTWQSTRLLPAEGVNDCFTYRNTAYLGYGITWWLNRNVENSYDRDVDLVPNDGVAGLSGNIAPSAEDTMVMAAGVGHQRLYLFPQERMVVVRFAALTSDNWSDQQFVSRLLGLL